jgi:hypothetical protein
VKYEYYPDNDKLECISGDNLRVTFEPRTAATKATEIASCDGKVALGEDGNIRALVPIGNTLPCDIEVYKIAAQRAGLDLYTATDATDAYGKRLANYIAVYIKNCPNDLSAYWREFRAVEAAAAEIDDTDPEANTIRYLASADGYYVGCVAEIDHGFVHFEGGVTFYRSDDSVQTLQSPDPISLTGKRWVNRQTAIQHLRTLQAHDAAIAVPVKNDYLVRWF